MCIERGSHRVCCSSSLGKSPAIATHHHILSGNVGDGVIHVLTNMLTHFAEERRTVVGSNRPPFLAVRTTPALGPC